ncbi:hypothetical protein D6825_01640, partial [Candidatus Woesearchaeota archaeon]
MARHNHPHPSKLDKIFNWLEKLNHASKTHAIVCEHKKARDILKESKMKNVYYPLEPLEDFVDLLAGLEKPIILLYDPNAKSNRKCEKLKALLQQRKVRVNTRFRKLLYTTQMDTAGLLKHIRRLAGSPRIFQYAQRVLKHKHIEPMLKPKKRPAKSSKDKVTKAKEIVDNMLATGANTIFIASPEVDQTIEDLLVARGVFAARISHEEIEHISRYTGAK